MTPWGWEGEAGGDMRLYFFLFMRGAGDEGDMKGTGWGGSERECKVVVVVVVVVVGWDVEQDTRRGR